MAPERIRDTGVGEVLPMQKYDIEDVRGGSSAHYWSPIGVPLPGPDGRTRLIVLRAEDVSNLIDEGERARIGGAPGDDWRRRALEVEADLYARAQQLTYARAQQLTAALEAKERSARRLTLLAEVALELTAVSGLEELEEVVVGRGLAVLGPTGEPSRRSTTAAGGSR